MLHSPAQAQIKKFIFPVTATPKSTNKTKKNLNQHLYDTLVVNKTSMLKKTINELDQNQSTSKVEKSGKKANPYSQQNILPPKSATAKRKAAEEVKSPKSNLKFTSPKDGKARNIYGSAAISVNYKI